MRKISILTFWGVANFGAWTQAYALNKILHQICDQDTIIEHIAYLEKSHWDMYYKHDSRLNNAFSYSWDLIPHTDIIDKNELEKRDFDIVCIGSDSVWELNPHFNDDMHLFGQQIKYNKLFSYATSFGNIRKEDLPKQIRDTDFNSFENISVRDSNSQLIIEELTGITPKIVVDPALLWNFRSDRNVKTPVFDKYILVYGASWTDDFIYEARKYARKHDLKLISAGFTNAWCDMNLRLVELRAIEWIGLFARAEKVYTSTFHGLMMGLNFERDIKFCQVEYVKNRSQTLIDELDIAYDIQNFDRTICYEMVNKKLETMKRESMEYLSEGIKS